MRRHTILLAVAALAVVTMLVAGSPATAKSDRVTAGTAIFGADQEPNTLNYLTDAMLWMSLVTNKVHADGMRYNENADLIPLLMDGTPRVVKQRPFTTTHRYKATAVWSDGRPVTGQNYVTAWRTYMNPDYNIESREGWDQIRSVRANGKSVTIVWKAPYVAWMSIAAGQPLPSHAMPSNFNQGWSDSIGPSSGPFTFQSWQKGVQLTIVKNPRFRIEPAKLDRIVFRFIPNTATQFQALRSGEVHFTNPQPQLQLAEIKKDNRFRVQSGSGFFYEHIDIQFGAKGHPALKRPYVRQALMQGINRPQIGRALYGAYVEGGLPPTNSLLYMPFQKSQYKAPFKQWGFGQKKVIAKLKANNCTGGPDRPSSGNNAIFSCPGVGKLSFRFTSTAGNQLRELTFEIIQRQLRSVGIELLPRFGPAATVFGTVLGSGDWDLFMFTWLSSPTHAVTSDNLYGCGGDQNFMNYCNRKVDKSLKAVKTVTDPQRAVQMLNGAEAIMAKDIPSIPLYQRPEFYVHRSNLRGLKLNPTQAGITWNAETWSLVS